MTYAFQYIKGMHLHFKNKGSMKKYHFQSNIAPSEKKYIDLFGDICKDDEEIAKILGILLGFNGTYYGGVSKRQCLKLLDEWKEFLKLKNPYYIFGLNTISDYRNFLTDTMTGSEALTQYKRGNLHPVAFCILLDIFEIDGSYKSMNWRLEQSRIKKLREALKSLHTYQQLVFRTNDYFETLGE